MTDSPEFDFIQSVHAQWHVISTDVQFKWMAQWTDLHNLSHGAGCLNPVFHAYDHITCPKALTDLFTMCDKIHGEGSAESAKAQLHWHCLVMFLQGKERHNVLNRQYMDKCSKAGSGGMV